MTKTTTLTHANYEMSYWINAYCLAIQHLLKNPYAKGKGQEAYDIAFQFAKKWSRDLEQFLLTSKRLVGKEGKDG